MPIVQLSVLSSQQSVGLPPMPLPQLVKPAPQTQAPAEHVEFVTQAIPQPPQCVLLVATVVSQPFIALPSQLPKPMLHDAIAHEPVAHVAVALLRAQAAPHAPQFVSVLVGASQPFIAFASQLPKPMLHDCTAHVPVLHVGVAFGVAHATRHPPQFATVFSRTSQPFASLMSQSPKPMLQVAIEHIAAEHAPLAFAGAHALLHIPQ
jgi:hypothetical protein